MSRLGLLDRHRYWIKSIKDQPSHIQPTNLKSSYGSDRLFHRSKFCSKFWYFFHFLYRLSYQKKILISNKNESVSSMSVLITIHNRNKTVFNYIFDIIKDFKKWSRNQNLQHNFNLKCGRINPYNNLRYFGQIWLS